VRGARRSCQRRDVDSPTKQDRHRCETGLAIGRRFCSGGSQALGHGPARASRSDRRRLRNDPARALRCAAYQEGEVGCIRGSSEMSRAHRASDRAVCRAAVEWFHGLWAVYRCGLRAIGRAAKSAMFAVLSRCDQDGAPQILAKTRRAGPHGIAARATGPSGRPRAFGGAGDRKELAAWSTQGTSRSWPSSGLLHPTIGLYGRRTTRRRSRLILMEYVDGVALRHRLTGSAACSRTQTRAPRKRTAMLPRILAETPVRRHRATSRRLRPCLFLPAVHPPGHRLLHIPPFKHPPLSPYFSLNFLYPSFLSHLLPKSSSSNLLLLISLFTFPPPHNYSLILSP
jgi:hypothetical protein